MILIASLKNQRLTIISGGLTTVYPTANYNTDGTKKTKHIMAGPGVVATLETTGTTTTPHYVATDHLTGSNVVTTQAGVQEELIDYYPFGSIRLDEKASSFSEQRKFTGQEYDADTGLSYMNARYYNGTIGRFISQDPLAIEALQTTDPKEFVQIISNPQNWNTYSYALNNPLRLVDPSGLLTVIIPGTGYNPETWASSKEGRGFQARVEQTFNEKPILLHWSNDDNRWARTEAANQLAQLVNGHKFADGEKLNIITHSHGGNIALEATHTLNRQIDVLVTLALPVLSDYAPKARKINQHINVYSYHDIVQGFAGNQTSYTELLGSQFGKIGQRIGEFIGIGEFGFAGRTFSGAINQDATMSTLFSTPVGAHSKLWRSERIWNKYVVPNIRR